MLVSSHLILHHPLACYKTFDDIVGKLKQILVNVPKGELKRRKNTEVMSKMNSLSSHESIHTKDYHENYSHGKFVEMKQGGHLFLSHSYMRSTLKT